VALNLPGLKAWWRAANGPGARDFLRARAHFRERWPDGPIAAQDYVVFDCESTGLRPSEGDRLLSLGAVRVRNAEPVAEFATLVNPGRPIPPASIRYHGITDARVAGAPAAPEALAAFAAFAGDDVLVAHSAAFDRTLLYMEEHHGAPALPNAFLCSAVTSLWLDPAEHDHSLDGLCGRLGIVIQGRHEALGDARATAELWVQLLARAGARGVEDLADLVRRTRMEARMAESAEHF
jgi:DNA polymerase-3 subunit epsilon